MNWQTLAAPVGGWGSIGGTPSYRWMDYVSMEDKAMLLWASIVLCGAGVYVVRKFL
jgi:hypothetical protein